MLLLLFVTLYATSILGTPIVEDLSFDNNRSPRLINPEKVFPDAYLTTTELIEKHGYQGETHRVITKDNYILELHRIPGRKNETKTNKPVIFLMHGLLANSATWVLPGPGKALVYMLADAGYDVWMGNARGNTYSRKHVTLTTRDKDYWQFSWHEIAVHDLPTSIDYVLKETKQKNLIYLGHSQGTTTFFAMSSVLPEYQSKIKAMFAFAPVAYGSRMPSPFIQLLAQAVDSIELLGSLIGQYEFKPTNDLLRKFAATFCSEDAITHPLCWNVLFMIGGYNPDQMNKTLLPTILGHVPSGASAKQFVHYGQLIRSGRFTQFDHGFFGNLRKYKSMRPPSYNLRSIKVPVYFHYSTNDWLAHVRDVHQLYNELGNPVLKLRVPDEKFNHLDFLWAVDAKPLLYDKVLSLLLRLDNN